MIGPAARGQNARRLRKELQSEAISTLCWSLRSCGHGRSVGYGDSVEGPENCSSECLRFPAVAGSFVVLGLTGLNLLYGRYIILPIVGPEVFSAITTGGKYAHNYLAFAFMVGLGLSFLLWVRHNIPSKIDLQWLRMGGGIFKKGVHPPAKKFNAGQKIIFWVTMVGGLSVSLSGIALMFPFQTTMFADTFAIFNAVGLNLPTDLTPIQEQQYNQIWHGVVSLVLMVIIVAHIYIGSVGMEGAIDAMHSGEVDLNWAKEHHNLWVEEEQQKTKGSPSPAE